MIRLCFVCLGNICRSPTAEGVMIHLVKEAGLEQHIAIDSAGTAAYHVGKGADPRTLSTAKARGVKLPSIARQFTPGDFDSFDYVLAMDHENRENLLRLARHDSHRHKVHLLRSFDPEAPRGSEVPDPYYGGAQGFEDVFDICHRACTGLLQHLRREHAL